MRRSWVIAMLGGLAVASGAAVWVYMANHPPQPLVNHAVAAAPGPSSAN